ncbi:hypothetical protein THAOC_24155, partial [Thalassiosira oceanica]
MSRNRVRHSLMKQDSNPSAQSLGYGSHLPIASGRYLGSPLRFGRPPGTLDPGDGCPTDRLLQWLPDQSGRPASSPYQYAACSQAGALGPIADRPFTLRMYLEEDLGVPPSVWTSAGSAGGSWGR